MSPEMAANAVIALTATTLLVVIWVLLVVRSRRNVHGRLDLQMVSHLDSLEHRNRADGEALRRVVTEMDQAIRKEIATGATEGLATAFDKVQEGTRAQSEQFGRFGGELRDALGDMRIEITGLAEKVSTASTDLRTLLVHKLTEAETAAADGRALSLRDATEAVARTQRAIEQSLTVFGEQQGERLTQTERAVREGGNATQFSLTEFRTEMSARLDGVREVAGEVLAKAGETFASIKGAVEASGTKVEKTLSEQREAITTRISEGQAQVSDRLGKDLGELSVRLRSEMDGFSDRLRQEQEQLRGMVSQKLEEIRAGNEAKLA
jgi:hypothetical protein